VPKSLKVNEYLVNANPLLAFTPGTLDGTGEDALRLRWDAIPGLTRAGVWDGGDDKAKIKRVHPMRERVHERETSRE